MISYLGFDLPTKRASQIQLNVCNTLWRRRSQVLGFRFQKGGKTFQFAFLKPETRNLSPAKFQRYKLVIFVVSNRSRYGDNGNKSSIFD